MQLTWQSYLHSTGLRSIQYRLCDAYTDPPGIAERLHTETLVRLPDTQWCYRPFLSPAAAAMPPCAKNGFVTFGAFHQSNKMSPVTRRLWAQVLAAVPQSRLLRSPLPRLGDGLGL